MIGAQVRHRYLTVSVIGQLSSLALRPDGSAGEISCGPPGDENPGHSSSESRVGIPTAERARVPRHCSSAEG